MQTSHTPIRVLLVDDHPTMLWGLERLIDGEKPRMEVVGSAMSGEDAIAQLPALVPDVALLDLDLAGRSGLEVLPALSAAHVRVLILTAEREQKKLDEAMFHGARGVVRKDAPAEHVLQAITATHRGELWLDTQSLGRVFSALVQTSRSGVHDIEAERQASLTVRERKIIMAVVEQSGAGNTALAQRLCIAEHTLRNHLTSIYHKLGVSNRLELYVYAVKHHLGEAVPA